ncbi:acyltransferase family protein [Corynebacterium pseudokroppenstedtii]|uniref:Acyltransferase family protein n=1 Tax=Corynebacterium pseudokroppenstedtii TaxID=2804917 RepID=A0AAU0Q493_9CORY|nr:acyltransferase family protein [Corynebacterium pseudokroppenstedtii]QRP15062.1 acyltransferase family protein [Corynebacterium kroppenstedtii]MBY0790913.1 acyltransferase family protein [Corynebacterium pseudokroppenstedtii]MCF6792727.1 acyltransferase family protein [Corynebacterium pseudokroppenstedtii]MCF8702668.1 acyltransferase family protein [Corynebacterium pseudokroppenstedtii]MCG2636183.1 acyltransferase family protein [Corynebacterium pseudokroppenstedtii]
MSASSVTRLSRSRRSTLATRGAWSSTADSTSAPQDGTEPPSTGASPRPESEVAPQSSDSAVTASTTGTTETPAPRKKQRLLWPDIGKGISILGVCFLHATIYTPDGVYTAANAVNDWLGPVRLPMFFMVSGLFSYKVRRQTLGELWHSRLRFLLIPYLVWAPLELWSKMWANNFEIDTHEIVTSVIHGECGLWFLHCLVLFTLAVWVTKWLPDHWALAVSVLPWLWQMYNPVTPTQSHIFNYMPVYFVGVFMRPALLALARKWRSPWWWAGSFALFWCTKVAYSHFGDSYDHLVEMGIAHNDAGQLDVLFSSIRALGALPLSILVCALVAQIPLLARPLQYIGQRTLVIYLFHMTAMNLTWDRALYVYGIREDVTNASDNVRMVCIIGLFILCLASGWVVEQCKRLPVVGWTIRPSIPFFQFRLWERKAASAS